MISLPKESSRPSYQVLAASIQNQIARGRYALGQKLPNEKELAGAFDVSVATVRQGIGLLVRKGLLSRQQGRGTFVRERTPVTANIALLFGPNLSNETAHFYRALFKRLREGAEARNWSCRHYDPLNAEVSGTNQARKQKETLLVDHANNPFSALIEVSPPACSPVMTDLPDIPLITYSSREADVKLDFYDFGRKTVRKLGKLGHRRLFFFQTRWALQTLEASFQGGKDEAAAQGLPEPALRINETVTEGYEAEKEIFEIFRELFHNWEHVSGDSIPDAIIFNDDIVLRAAAPVIYAWKKTTGKEIAVATMGSQDVRFHCALPVIRYQVSQAAIADLLLTAAEKKLSGQTVETEHVKGTLSMDQ